MKDEKILGNIYLEVYFKVPDNKDKTTVFNPFGSSCKEQRDLNFVSSLRVGNLNGESSVTWSRPVDDVTSLVTQLWRGR